MSNTRKLDVKSLIAAAKRPELAVTLNLRGDLIAAIQELEQELVELQQRTSQRLADHPDAVKLAQKIHDLEAEADQSKITLRFVALPGPDWRKAIAKHPPTSEQRAEGYISNSYEVVREVFLDSLVSPEMDAEDRDALLDVLTEGQHQELNGTIFKLNGGDNTIPFSRIASLVAQNSEDEPKSPDPTE
jgi:hypothetical protein